MLIAESTEGLTLVRLVYHSNHLFIQTALTLAVAKLGATERVPDFLTGRNFRAGCL